MSDLLNISKEILESAGFKLSSEEENLLNTAAEWPNVWASTISALYSSKISERSLKEHAEALNRAAEASDRNAASLRKATWCLAGATVVLAIATVGLLFSTLLG